MKSTFFNADGKKFKVYFVYPDRKKESSPSTTVMNLVEEGNPEPIAQGIAKLSKKDRFEYKLGRKTAAKKLVQNLSEDLKHLGTQIFNLF